MILKTLFQRLQAGLADGPGLNARPHHSRQRVDLTHFIHLGGPDPSQLLKLLLDSNSGTLTFPGKDTGEPAFKLLARLRDIAADASDYLQDHGESSLFIGFPLLSIPPVTDRAGNRSRRILAPIALIPIQLSVRRHTGGGVHIEASGQGADRLIPNPALFAWLEQQTGESAEKLLGTEIEEPRDELAALLNWVIKSVRPAAETTFNPDTPLQAVPRPDSLPPGASLLPSAVLGLFPISNPGLLRDIAWMRDHPDELAVPVTGFLRPEALNEPAAPNPSPEAEPVAPVDSTTQRRRFTDEFPVAPADPCQAEAVAHARHAPALVVHGPPGTGKSQTIANIIGDHLARGQRVLFVCDKRTALDVVQYRLAALGLGDLCGVIHDAQGDRRDFYLQLRATLDSLTEAPVLPDPGPELDRTNARLTALHSELYDAFLPLHSGAPAQSFHQLCGEWLRLRSLGTTDLVPVPNLQPQALEHVRAEIQEVATRALNAHWATSPFRDRLALTPESWRDRNAAAWTLFLTRLVDLARTLDSTHPLQTSPHGITSLPIPANLPYPTQAATRRRLAQLLSDIHQSQSPELDTRIADEPQSQRWFNTLSSSTEFAELDQPLDRDLWPAMRDHVPDFAEIRRLALALDAWAEVAGSWKRFVSFTRRTAVKPLFDRLALPLTPEGTARARALISALQIRWTVSELRSEILGAAPQLASDPQLIALRDNLPRWRELRALIDSPSGQPVAAPILDSLRNPANRQALIQALTDSAQRADQLYQIEQHVLPTGFLTAKAWEEWATQLGSELPALPLADEFFTERDTLEDAVRLIAREATLPTPVQTALQQTTRAQLDPEQTLAALQAAALGNALRDRIQSQPALARIDSQRVEAALDELGKLTELKARQVRALILHQWQKLWRERLLASTGSRLNSLGASLRQRLFVRGQRALKLRQMIATGAGTPDGDPLFDLCPIWMASPATVAQVFPREATFDVVLFDEASQCRLEEALPVLLRARRVVIAGDPRQLPPTRFFESAPADSDEAEAANAEEVFNQQQVGAEDLLSAALNLAVQESFLDVHYRSRHAALIEYSNHAFYGSRLQPIPGNPARTPALPPIHLIHVDGIYLDRGNESEARAAVDLVAQLLALPNPPSIGIACFNLPQRDLILDSLDERAGSDAEFAARLEVARARQGAGSFEGLFVKNLENVQGDERDHLILSTTFGPGPDGRFIRNFGALSRSGGERRLNVLVTRARERVHILTSIPRTEYHHTDPAAGPVTGRHHLYAYLRHAEAVTIRHQPVTPTSAQSPVPAPATATCHVQSTRNPSALAIALGQSFTAQHQRSSTVHWGNDGFCVDIALIPDPDPAHPATGILTDFNRYTRTPDPIAWEQFRTALLRQQGWELRRVWSPDLFRDPDHTLTRLAPART